MSTEKDKATAAASSTDVPRWEAGPFKISSPVLLRSDNYPIWRLETIIHLRTADLWHIVDGSEEQPLRDPHRNWAHANNQASSILIQLVSKKFKGIIGNNLNAADSWKTLEKSLDS